MTAAELLILVEDTGGELTAHPDGQLTGKGIPCELHDALRALETEIIALLQAREPKAAPPAAKPAFLYKPRSVAAWAARAATKWNGEVSPTVARKFSRGLVVEPTTETTTTVTPAVAVAVGPKTLIPREALQRAHERYLQEQAAQAMRKEKTKKAKLLEAAAEADLTALTAKQISEFTGLTQSQVRRILRAVGITLAKVGRGGR
jgi:hypothetical protein